MLQSIAELCMGPQVMDAKSSLVAQAGCINAYVGIPGILRKSRGYVALHGPDGAIVDRMRYRTKPPAPQVWVAVQPWEERH